MTDSAAFLQTIADSPDDDFPRLVYADWLGEQGECEQEELIRLSCALAEMKKERLWWPAPTAPTEDVPRFRLLSINKPKSDTVYNPFGMPIDNVQTTFPSVTIIVTERHLAMESVRFGRTIDVVPDDGHGIYRLTIRSFEVLRYDRCDRTLHVTVTPMPMVAPTDNRHVEMEARVITLQTNISAYQNYMDENALAKLPQWAFEDNHYQRHFDRGLIVTLGCNCLFLRNVAHIICRYHPIHTIRLTDWQEPALPEGVENPFPNLKRLELLRTQQIFGHVNDIAHVETGVAHINRLTPVALNTHGQVIPADDAPPDAPPIGYALSNGPDENGQVRVLLNGHQLVNQSYIAQRAGELFPGVAIVVADPFAGPIDPVAFDSQTTRLPNRGYGGSIFVGR